MIISILNEKGGCGKTTISINIARYLKIQGYSTLLIDSDPQQSASSWHAHAKGELLDVVSIAVPTIDKDARKLNNNYDFIVIDGAPQASPLTVKSLICADLLLIPVPPSPLDIWGTERVADLVEEQLIKTEGKFKSAFVVSKHRPNTRLSNDIDDVLRKYNLPILKSRSNLREVYPTSLSEGGTVFELKTPDARQAQKDIEDIATEALNFYKGI